MKLRWRADEGPTLNTSLAAMFQGIRTSIAKKPYSLAIFQGRVLSPTSPPLDPCNSKTMLHVASIVANKAAGQSEQMRSLIWACNNKQI